MVYEHKILHLNMLRSLKNISFNINFLCFSAVSELAPIIVSSAFSYCSNETTKIRPNLPEEEVTVDMMVLAKKKTMRWQRGKILEIITKGKKITFFFSSWKSITDTL